MKPNLKVFIQMLFAMNQNVRIGTSGQNGIVLSMQQATAMTTKCFKIIYFCSSNESYRGIYFYYRWKLLVSVNIQLTLKLEKKYLRRIGLEVTQYWYIKWKIVPNGQSDFPKTLGELHWNFVKAKIWIEIFVV